MIFKNIDADLISNYRLCKKAGCPSRCRVELRVSSADASKWLNLEDLAVFDANDSPVFFGKCEHVELSGTPGGSTALIGAVVAPGTGSVSRRFFQKPEKTFDDILKRIKIENCSVELDGALKSKLYPPLLMQAQSDFDFLLRLARESGRRLWIIDTRENAPALALKFCLDKSTKKFDSQKIINLCKIRTHKLDRLRVASREYCELGRLASIEGCDGIFLVTGLCATLKNGREVFWHDLERYKESDRAVECQADGQCYVLPGRIADVADPDKLGRVRFAVAPDYAEDDSEKSWLPWLTPYSGAVAGMVFIPEKDDPAELVVAGGRGVAHGALREKALDEEASDVASKFLGNNSTRRIIWKKDSLEIRSGKTSIILKDDEIVLDCADSRIWMGKNGISLESGKDLTIKTQGKLNATISEKATMISDGDIGLKSGSTVAIQGSRVELG